MVAAVIHLDAADGGERLAAQGVAQWSTIRIQNCWGDELGVARADEDFPAGAVHVSVVGLAQQNTVLHAGLTTLSPGPAMVSLAQPRWSVAAGEGASPVPGDERAA